MMCNFGFRFVTIKPIQLSSFTSLISLSALSSGVQAPLLQHNNSRMEKSFSKVTHKLSNNTDDVADAKKAVELDASMGKAYLSKVSRTKPLTNQRGECQQREACFCWDKASFYQGNWEKAPKPNSFRIAIVGDIHEEWLLEHDSKALQFLHPDLVMFTGDFGNENVELVKGITTLNFPKAAILGNHDSWSTSKFSKKMKDGVQIQLECLGEAHVGYGHLDFPSLNLSVVGGRPFSCGGNQLFRKKLLTPRYGVHDMEESAERIYKAALGTPEEHSIIFLAHNGPTGLGSNVDDICGIDWECAGGDHGDPDLAKAISQVKETTKYHISLVVFGHMHKELVCGGLRKMVAVDAENTIYLNAAIVPRVRYPKSGGSTRAFTVVQFSDGKITKVAETWVSIIDDKASLEEELLLFTSTTN